MVFELFDACTLGAQLLEACTAEGSDQAMLVILRDTFEGKATKTLVDLSRKPQSSRPLG